MTESNGNGQEVIGICNKCNTLQEIDLMDALKHNFLYCREDNCEGRLEFNKENLRV